MKVPGFTAEMSLYKSTGGYIVALNGAAVRGGMVVPAQRPMDAPPTAYASTLTPGVVFMMKKVCWDERTSTSKFAGLTFLTECQLCQWFRQQYICTEPPACFMGWVPVGAPSDECDTSLVGIG